MTHQPPTPRPSALDRAIAWLSPEAGAKRMAWRQISASYRGGVGTRLSERFDRATGYSLGTASDRQLIGSARDRAYQAYRDNPVARTLVQTETDNVIGDGLNYQPSSSSEAWNREAKDRYYAWIDQASTRGGDIHNGAELQRLIWDRSRVAGDIGWILVARGAESLIQVVPGENIVTPDGMFGQGVTDGIRFDAAGRPQAFYVLDADEYGKRTFATVSYRDFVYLPHYTEPNQARGATCYLTIFDLLAHLDRYVDGVSLAAWMATVFGIIFKQASGAREVAQLGFLNNSQGQMQRAVTFENGMVKYVGTGDEVAQVQATQPMSQTPEFIRTMMRLLGQPFDMPLAVAFKDTSQENFASARIGLLPFYRSCRIKAGRFGTRWSRTIRWWLSRERLRASDDPKRWKTAFPEDFWSHDLLPNAFDYTDPVSEVQSDILQVEAGFKSPMEVLNERGGKDPVMIAAQRKAWENLGMPEAHLTLTRDPVPQRTAAPTDTKDNADGQA